MTGKKARTLCTLIVIVALLTMFYVFAWPGKIWGATQHVVFTYPTEEGTSGRWIAWSGDTGDSVTGGTLTEKATRPSGLTVWTGSAADFTYTSYVIEGIIVEGSDTSTGSYVLDLRPLEVQDSTHAYDGWIAHQSTVDTLVDSLSSQDGWVAHQTTIDSLWDSLLAVRGSLLVVLDSLENMEAWIAQQTEVAGLIAFLGACDECYQRLYPEGGQANKDSVVIIDPSLGADSLIAKIVFKHGTTPTVYDSSYFYLAPWW